jgi:hypothetical protein
MSQHKKNGLTILPKNHVSTLLYLYEYVLSMISSKIKESDTGFQIIKRYFLEW